MCVCARQGRWEEEGEEGKEGERLKLQSKLLSACKGGENLSNKIERTIHSRADSKLCIRVVTEEDIKLK